MMTELSFLIELLLNHDLPKVTKDLVADRIRTVEQNFVTPPSRPIDIPLHFNQTGIPQASSTLANMMKHGDTSTAVVPVEQIAQTPAAAAGMINRQAQMNAALAGNAPMKTRVFKNG